MIFDPDTSVQTYLTCIARLDHIAGLVLFGSAVSGSSSTKLSDVDLILVVPDNATAQHRCYLRDEVRCLEIAHGFRRPETRKKNALERFAERAGGNANACFICTRSDLLSGDAGRIFGLRPIENFFVDRIVLASVIVSAVTTHGEDLLPLVPLPPIRRLDVFKSLFNLASLLTLCTAAFPVLPDATKYAMGALKHSLHACYFCYRLRNAPLDEEIEFFGPDAMLSALLEQRRKPSRSFIFVLRCVPALFRLHLRTARENRFPRSVARAAIPVRF